MASVNLEDFESRLILRQVRVEDYAALIELERRCFPGIETWKREHIESQVAHFPEGQLCLELDGKIVASSGSLIVNFDDYDAWQSWREIADDGYRAGSIAESRTDAATLRRRSGSPARPRRRP
jgi:hypothetical protein